MRRLSLVTIMLAGAALAACGDQGTDYSDENDTVETAPVEIAPPPVEPPPVDPAPDESVEAEATPYEAPLPQDQRSSAESVQPESETLFY